MKYTFYILFLLFLNQLAYSQEGNNNMVFEYENVQIKPQYPGGRSEFMKFVMKNYQTEELEGLSGIVMVSMVIELDGTIKDVKVLKDIGGNSAAEAKRVVGKLQKWTPAKNNGQPVRVKYEFPITIQ